MDKNITPGGQGRSDRRYDPLTHTPGEENVDDFGRGQLLALMTVVDVLIQTHPDAARLRTVYNDAHQRLLALTVPSLVSDDYIEGVHEVHSRVAPLLGMVDG